MKGVYYEAEKLLNSYLSDENCKSLSTETISKYNKTAPEILLNLWTSNGVGKYGNGIVEIINCNLRQTGIQIKEQGGTL